MSDTIIPSTMPFDDAEQEAIVSHSFVDQDFFLKVHAGVKPHDFTDAFLIRVDKSLVEFHERFKRLPTLEEIQREHLFTKAELGTRKRMVEILSRQPQRRSELGVDYLKRDIERWLKAKIALKSITDFARLYNTSGKDPNKLDQALAMLPEMGALVESTTFDSGPAGHHYSADEDCRAEKPMREKERILSYGVDYLDDALGGMAQHDLVLVGAKTGAGKSQLVTAIAQHVARNGGQVNMFALEAEKHEIARRIKFSMLASEYFNDRKRVGSEKAIRYGAWRRNQLQAELDKYESKVQGLFDNELKNLKVKYREDGLFDNDRLEKEVKAVASSTSLIIIDHIHYVDIDGENENAAHKRIIKTLRDLVLRHGVPVIVVAHLRKTMPFRDKALVPNNEDFHGTSDLTKIATTCILMGKAERPQKLSTYLRPTHMRITKSRIEGDLSWLAATCDFDTRKNVYNRGYDLGYLRSGDSEYDKVPENERPYWAEKLWGKPGFMRDPENLTDR